MAIEVMRNAVDAHLSSLNQGGPALKYKSVGRGEKRTIFHMMWCFARGRKAYYSMVWCFCQTPQIAR